VLDGRGSLALYRLGILELAKLRLQRLQLAVGEGQAGEFLQLVAQQLLAIRIGAVLVAQPCELPPQRLPSLRGVADAGGVCGRAGQGVEERALRRTAQQRLVRVLAMDVDEILAKLRAVLQRRRPSIDVGA
jgi:hypothetical protein